ncbi:hypothetical protein NDU88_007919 [Pleurodeles waltl]|uniref:Uncharacterized protein n=1 Tax=Pleurodeles waltl TaxID=8319 RepID=A0AAV7VR25_PLEWA|nr:hypothetical protein NDU88_007919 [Pleurodeles waltl]
MRNISQFEKVICRHCESLVRQGVSGTSGDTDDPALDLHVRRTPEPETPETRNVEEVSAWFHTESAANLSDTETLPKSQQYF